MISVELVLTLRTFDRNWRKYCRNGGISLMIWDVELLFHSVELWGICKNKIVMMERMGTQGEFFNLGISNSESLRIL